MTPVESIAYDKAKWHYGGEFPEDLDDYQGFVHTGMFLGWLMENDLVSDFFKSEGLDCLQRFLARESTGAQIYEEWDGVLTSEMLSDLGNAFAQDYYDITAGGYMADYETTLCKGLPTTYHVRDTWENYEKIKQVIDRRYQAWRAARR
ncbi:MAG TPA: hypothetical protein PKW95_22070 [bacterium]|nr:hypothetical protein [bacterium]